VKFVYLIVKGEVTYRKKFEVRSKSSEKFMQLVGHEAHIQHRDVCNFGYRQAFGYESVLTEYLAGLRVNLARPYPYTVVAAKGTQLKCIALDDFR
jgi:hypothetical protein